MKSNRGASASALLLVLTAVLLCFVCQEAAAQKDYSCFRAPANPGDRRKIPTRYAHIVFCIVADLIFDFQFSSFATTCKIVVHVTEFNLSEDLRLPPSIPNGCSWATPPLSLGFSLLALPKKLHRTALEQDANGRTRLPLSAIWLKSVSHLPQLLNNLLEFWF